MFKGTPRFGKGALDRLVSSRGGEWNAFTTEDFTAYYEVLPSEYLALAVEIEADRMAGSTFDLREVEAERSVIISEREGAENHPVFWLTEAVEAAAWTVHPYRQGVIGAKCDLCAMTRDDLYAHYRSYYSPDNAAVVAAGDFSAEDLFALVERHFGIIPRGRPRRPVRSVEPPQTGQRRLVVRRPGPAQYLLAAYHIPEAGNADIPALLVLTAAMSGAASPVQWRGRRMGKSSRLYRGLVSSGLAVRVDAQAGLRADPGLLEVLATAAPGIDVARVEDALETEILSLRSGGLTAAELETAKRQLEAQIAYTRGGALGHAEWLGFFGALGDPGLARRLGAAVAAVSAEEVRGVARTYLHADNATVGIFRPAGCTGEAGGQGGGGGDCARWPASRETTRGTTAGPRGNTFAAGSAHRGRRHLPGPEDIAREVLESGLTVLCCRNEAAEYVELLLRLPAGSRWDPAGLEGAGEYSARGLLCGTQDLSFDEYNERLDRLGASLSGSSSPDAAHFRGSCLAGDLRGFAGLLAAALARPSFLPADMQRLKAELLTRISERDQDTYRFARRLALEHAYPTGHAYGRPPLGLKESVERISSPDLRSFHAAHCVPAGAILAAVGPLDPEEAIRILAEAFGEWVGPASRGPAREEIGGAVEDRPLPEPGGPGWPGPYRKAVLHGKTQADLAMALPALPRSAPEFEEFFVLNLILGGLGLGGRLGRRVRDDLGLAYYCFSAVAEREGKGPWLLHIGANPDNVALVLETVLEELERVRCQPVSAEELQEAVGFARGSLALQLEAPSGLAGWLVRMEAHGLGLDYLQEYPTRLDGQTPEGLLEAAHRTLRPARTALAVVGPPEPAGQGRGGPGAK